MKLSTVRSAMFCSLVVVGILLLWQPMTQLQNHWFQAICDSCRRLCSSESFM